MPPTSVDTGSIANGPVSLNIILVGAGLGGLATAIALTQGGHKVTVYEQAPELGEVGAGIQIPSNSTRLLFKLGLKPYLLPYVRDMEDIFFRRWQNGKVIGRTKLAPDFVENFGAPYYVIHRAHFHSALCQRAYDLGIEIKLGAQAVDFNALAGSVTLSDGTIHTADLVIAADGKKIVTGLYFCIRLFVCLFVFPSIFSSFLFSNGGAPNQASGLPLVQSSLEGKKCPSRSPGLPPTARLSM